MKITAVETFVVRMPLLLAGDAPMIGGQARTAIEMLLVRVDTDAGVTGWGEGFGVRVVPHSAYFGPGLLASIHVCAAQAREVWIERFYCDFEVTPFGDVIDPRGGRIAIPQGAGLGVDPDPAVLRGLAINA